MNRAFALAPSHGGTDGGNVIAVNGTDFGLPDFYPSQLLELHFGSIVCSLGQTMTCEAQNKPCVCNILEHTQELLKFTTPGGIGTDIPVVLKVEQQQTVATTQIVAVSNEVLRSR